MDQDRRRIILTAALPYANGPIHLGHLVEYCLADFWTRFQKMRGHECLYICADDTHGTPVMVSAKEKGISPEELVNGYFEQHKNDFDKFDIIFDNYSTTNTETNQQLAAEFFQKMSDGGFTEKRKIDQSYCEHDAMFLPDRFVKGACPKCGAIDQYGDSCDVCSATYAPPDMKNSQCILCGNQPIVKASEHIFFRLGDFTDFLKEWVPSHNQPEVANKLREWLDDGLKSWCISRDAPYFGFEIPGHPGKFFYVWVDAPIGYISSLKEWCDRNGKSLKEYWGEGSEVYNSIGKDIIYFHGLFWPAMLKSAGYKSPDGLFVHGMLMVNGVKMSKSKGTFINASTYLNHLDPLYIRYYLACKMVPTTADFDLNLDDFVSRVNSDLVGKITNVASRGATMIHKLDGVLGEVDPGAAEMIQKAIARGDQVAEYFENRDFSKGMLAIREIADDANRYFDEYEPWKLIKTDPEKTKTVLTTVLNLFRMMAIYLKPILPSYTTKVEALFGEEPYSWSDAAELFVGKPLNSFSHLVKRVDKKQVDAMVEETKKAAEKAVKKSKKPQSKAKDDAKSDFIGIKDFSKIDLRVGRVLAAEPVEGADKLLQLRVDLGPLGEKNVFAGIRKHYQAEELLERLVVVVANLQPRKMRFGLSEGMVLCAESNDSGKLFLMAVDEGAQPGDKIS